MTSLPASGWRSTTFNSLDQPRLPHTSFGSFLAFIGFMMSATAQNVVAFDLIPSSMGGMLFREDFIADRGALLGVAALGPTDPGSAACYGSL